MRLIDADNINNDEIQETSLNADSYITARTIIAKQPTIDAVPVIRCKDCKFREKYGISNSKTLFCCSHPKVGRWAEDCPDMHFCSYGERKEANE